MYINRLIEFAEENDDIFPPLGFRYKPVDWVVDIDDKDFTFSPIKQKFLVPDISRSSNTKAILLADKADYVFGKYDVEDNKSRSAERHEDYKNLLDNYLDAVDDKDVKLLRKRLDEDFHIDERVKMGDLIVFRIRSEEYLHDSQMVKDFWREYTQPKADTKSADFHCFVCHKNAPIMQRHKTDFFVNGEKTKLITANQNAYESHGLKKSFNAPMCYECMQKYSQALEYLLQEYKDKEQSGGPHMFKLGDLTYVYWIRGNKQLNGQINQIVQAQSQGPEKMKEAIDQAFSGITFEGDFNNFCLLVLSPNKGRLVVRDYVEDSAGHIKSRIQAFFDAQDIGHHRYYGIYALAATMYNEPTKQMQKYALEEWMGWFLHGRPLSGRILLAILNKIKSNGTIYPQQAAAVKSWLVSQSEGGGIMKTKDKGYSLGKAFAILEYIQWKAIKSNTTIASRFFGSASTTPDAIMGLLIRNAQHHLEKLKNDKKTRKQADNLEDNLGNVLSEIDEFPKTLGLTAQGQFALGYYHERQQLSASKNEKEKGEKVQ